MREAAGASANEQMPLLFLGEILEAEEKKSRSSCELRLFFLGEDCLLDDLECFPVGEDCNEDQEDDTFDQLQGLRRESDHCQSAVQDVEEQ